jgi:hypothetical protein
MIHLNSKINVDKLVQLLDIIIFNMAAIIIFIISTIMNIMIDINEFKLIKIIIFIILIIIFHSIISIFQINLFIIK